jgi:peptide/nickel transport system permease protein
LISQQGVAEILGAGYLRRPANTIKAITDFSRRKPLGAVGGVIVAIVVFLAIFAPLVSPFDPNEVHPKYSWAAPGEGGMLLGADQIGRDVLSRLIYGARISLYVGVVSVLIGASVGTLLGVASAYFGGKTDLIIQRVLDALMAFPGIILGITVLAAMGKSSLENVIIALVVVFTPGAARTIRARALSLKETDFVLAAQAVGASDWRIILRHILPNCMSLFIVFSTITVGFAIIVEATFSFLGIGAPPGEPSWGGMLTLAASKYIEVAPWLAIFPGVAIALVVFGFNLLGDALRDVLDPRLRGA